MTVPLDVERVFRFLHQLGDISHLLLLLLYMILQQVVLHQGAKGVGWPRGYAPC